MEKSKSTLEQNTDGQTQSQAKPALPARMLTAIRMKIRRMFKKEDPNIYPFF